jgi:hypothetical protein
MMPAQSVADHEETAGDIAEVSVFVHGPDFSRVSNGVGAEHDV